MILVELENPVFHGIERNIVEIKYEKWRCYREVVSSNHDVHGKLKCRTRPNWDCGSQL